MRNKVTVIDFNPLSSQWIFKLFSKHINQNSMNNEEFFEIDFPSLKLTNEEKEQVATSFILELKGDEQTEYLAKVLSLITSRRLATIMYLEGVKNQAESDKEDLRLKNIEFRETLRVYSSK